MKFKFLNEFHGMEKIVFHRDDITATGLATDSFRSAALKLLGRQLGHY
jgi:hypothetical protein